MRKYKLGKQKKFLMLTSILSIVLLMSTSIAAAAISRSVADSSTSESAESSDVSTSLPSDSTDDSATPSVDSSSDSAVSDDNVESSPSLSAPSAESNLAQPPNAAPVADFSFSPQIPTPGEEIIFDGNISYDPDGMIVSYYWSYTVGSSFPVFIANGNGSICLHAFDDPGNYLVSLKVTDNKGATDIMNKLVMVPYSPSVPSEAEADQSASTKLTATSEDEVISSDDDETTIQMQQTPSQKLINNILKQAAPGAQTTTYGIILFNATGKVEGCLATITHFETFGMAANINLDIISGTMHFKIFGGFVSAGPGDSVSLSMFRGIFWKTPPVCPVEVGDQVTRMIGMGWFST